jgi:hypothetical protein
MAEKAIRSQGTVLYYNVGGSPTAWTALGKVMSFSGPNAQAEEIDQTDLDDTQYMRKMAGLVNAGDASFEINLDPANAGHAALKAALEARTNIEVKVTPPSGSLSLYFDSAYVKGFQVQVPAKGKWTANLSIMIDGGYRWA